VGSGSGDLALVERCRLGDRAALAELVADFQRPVFNAAFRILGNRDDADDVTQTTFLKVFENLHRYDPAHKLFSWIYRIAINEALDQLHRGRRHETLEDDRLSDLDGPEELAGAERLSRRVQSGLMELTEDYRVVLVLRHFGGCSYEEIGEILHIPEKTVKSRIYSARQLLKDRLLSGGMDPS
jgi:RNA polymerase sigma-70 factor (ECF subfamily)